MYPLIKWLSVKFPFSQIRQGCSIGHSIQPGRELTVEPELIQVEIHLEKNVLANFFTVLLRSDQAPDQLAH